MKIVFGSDHAGFPLKVELKKYLEEKGIEVYDVGCPSLERASYSEFGLLAAEEVANKNADFGIVVCGTGIGISIAANKVKGIRCALCHSEEYARLTRNHNDANMLALGGRFITIEEAKKMVDTFLSETYEGGRHQSRIDTITNYELNRK